MNLIPQTPSTSPHYYCTWMAQCDEFVLVGAAGGIDNINEKSLFGPEGWLKNFYPNLRKDLFALCDAGWDTPPGVDCSKEPSGYGRMFPDPVRFPSLTGTPAEKLKQLADRIRDLGWKNAGIWLIAQGHGECFGHPPLPDERIEADWVEKAHWSAHAGIGYWKVDFGMRGESLVFRRMLTRVKNEHAPSIVIEHARNMEPFNGSPQTEGCNPLKEPGRFKTANFQLYRGGTLHEFTQMLLTHGDILRTYDVSNALSTATTLDRVATILDEGWRFAESRAILNAEDEAILGCVLNCAVGIMRYPSDIPHKMDPHRNVKRIDEVTRAILWSRFAPALPVNAVPVKISPEILTDEWLYRPGDVWIDWATGHTVQQAAPARVARNMDLPEVSCEGPAPFTICSTHPNGAVAVATLPRLRGYERYYPMATVEIQADLNAGPLGVFGKFKTLRIGLKSKPAGKRLMAQDLAGTEATDCTADVRLSETTLEIPGEVIEKFGLASATPGDLSDPGVVFRLI